MKFILPVVPELSLDERRKAFTRASEYAVKRGVTTVVDFGRFFPGAPVDSVWQDFFGELFRGFLFFILSVKKS